MKPLSAQQRSVIETYLDEQKLTFLPLRDELLDHLMSDIESHLDRGYSFEEAWQRVSGEIPDSYLRNIQTETMETIGKRFNRSRGLAISALALLLAASLFKLMHLQYSDMLLFASFGAMGTAFITSAVSGARLHKQKKGRLLLAGVVLGVVLFLVAWCMQVLHLPGSFLLRMSAALLLLILFPALIVYFRTGQSSDVHILTYLHEKHTPGINRFLLILLVMGLAFKLLSVTLAYAVSIPNVLLAFVIGGAGLQFFALHWHCETAEAASAKKYGILVVLTIGFVAFMIPTLVYNAASISPSVKVVAAIVFNLMAGGVLMSKSAKKVLPVVVVAIAWVYILAWASVNLGWVDPAANAVIYTIPVLVVLIGGLVASRRHRVLMTYMMTVVAHFLHFY